MRPKVGNYETYSENGFDSARGILRPLSALGAARQGAEAGEMPRGTPSGRVPRSAHTVERPKPFLSMAAFLVQGNAVGQFDRFGHHARDVERTFEQLAFQI